MSSLRLACVVLGLYSAYMAGVICIRGRSIQSPGTSKAPVNRFPLATFLLALAVALPTTLQFFFPAILAAFRRDYAGFSNGDWWRLFTPLFVQDGGVAGAVFNLVSLLLVGGVAEQLWGSGRMLGIFLVGGVVGEAVAFAWQPIGAGNSVGNFSLAASIAVVCLALQGGRTTRMAALLALSADAVLVLLKDIHGAAAVAGITLALALRGGWQGKDQQFERL
jgi:membrane associated rhomboid family serine protease